MNIVAADSTLSETSAKVDLGRFEFRKDSTSVQPLPGLDAKRLKYRWYRLPAQPPATIVAFLRKATDRNGRLLQRSPWGFYGKSHIIF